MTESEQKSSVEAVSEVLYDIFCIGLWSVKLESRLCGLVSNLHGG